MEGTFEIWIVSELATATISLSVSIFLLNTSLMTGLVDFIFHTMKILNYDNKLAFYQVMRL